MSIELHCPACTKLIRAPDDAGGKQGRCPYCKGSVYIPTPAGDEEEELRLAPLDAEEELRAKQLREESTAFIASVGHDDAPIPDEEPGAEGSRRPASSSTVVDLEQEVEAFLFAMRDSRLDEADAAVAELKQAGTRARDYVEGLALDELAPPIEGVPAPVAMGFLKTLLTRLG